MKTVDVAAIPSRTGQRVRNELIFGTTGGGAAAAPIYRLDVALRETMRNTLVTQQGEQLGRPSSFTRIPSCGLKDNEVVFKAWSNAQASYALSAQPCRGFHLRRHALPYPRGEPRRPQFGRYHKDASRRLSVQRRLGEPGGGYRCD